MCEMRCGHCHACCQFQREWCLFRQQLVSLTEKTCRERERDQTSPLNIYDLCPQRFLATFFAVFRGVSGGDPHTLTDPQTSMFECYTFAYIHSVCRESDEKRRYISLEWKVVNVAKC